MSKRIDYNNENNVAAADRATIAPNQAPNAAPAAAKSSKMTNGAKILAIVLIVLAVCAIALLVINLIIDSYVSKTSAGHYEEVEIEIAPEISNMGIYSLDFISGEKYKDAANDVLLNYAEASHSINSSETIYNFTVYGINKFAGAEKGLATFIMLASFNTETKKVTYVTIEEQILVYIPLVGVGELRDAYEWGGAALLTKTIKHNFGIDINGYIEIDMSVASALIDSVGGVAVSEINVAEMNEAIDSYNEKFKTEIVYPEVSNGKATLNGMQAIAYLRDGFASSKAVINALGNAIFSNGLKGMTSSFDVIAEGTKISFEKDDLIALAKMSISMLKNTETNTIHVGDDKTHFYIKNIFSFYMNDAAAERAELVNALYGEPKAE
ncbi:MAG: LCP family protein [Clostridia bacterium]|nr:LCP family protein [Clostridia bacterium]